MLGKVFRVLRDGTAVEVGDAEVEQYIKEVREVEEGLVGAVRSITKEVLHFTVDAENPVLHFTVDAENPERLHQQVEKQQEDDIFDEAVLHLYICYSVVLRAFS